MGNPNEPEHPHKSGQDAQGRSFAEVEKGANVPGTAFKKITDYTDDQLKESIQAAVNYCGSKGLDFWIIFRGFDAYNEQRTRKNAKVKK